MMNTIDEHELQAWIDGELASPDAARVGAAVAADPVLAARAARERRLRERLRGEFDAVLDEPVPARFTALLQGRADPERTSTHGPGRDHADGAASVAGSHTAFDGAPEAAAAPEPPRSVAEGAGKVVPLASRQRGPVRPRWSAPVYALAASLAVLAVSLWMRPAGGPVQVQDGMLVARGELARSLDTALASQPAGQETVAIGLSFRDAEGRVCRSFVQSGRSALAGLACREGSRWTLPVLSDVDGTTQGELRQASTPVPPAVQAAIDARLEGEVFDAEQEQAARESGWR